MEVLDVDVSSMYLVMIMTMIQKFTIITEAFMIQKHFTQIYGLWSKSQRWYPCPRWSCSPGSSCGGWWWQFQDFLSRCSLSRQEMSGWGGKTVSFGQVPARYLQLHLHQEDSVMVGEDLVYSLFATPLIVFGALSGLWPLASGLWPLAKGGWYQGLARTIGAGASNFCDLW